MDQAGNLYGTNSAGVFLLSPSPGGWTKQIIYGTSPSSGLTMEAAGNIYGTTSSTVFELSPNGTGTWNPTVIHTFGGAPKDGSNAAGTPMLDPAGNFHGVTNGGGTNKHDTVYKLIPGQNGVWTEQVLCSFPSGKNGGNPVSGVALDPPETFTE